METCTNQDTKNILYRTVVVVSVMLIIAVIHIFRVGTYLNGKLFTLYYSYFSDIIIPLGMYFLLGLNDRTLPLLRDWRMKAVLVFTVSSITEIMQAFGIYFLGVTFDPLDIVMFAVGVILAVFLDRVIFRNIFPFWSAD